MNVVFLFVFQMCWQPDGTSRKTFSLTCGIPSPLPPLLLSRSGVLLGQCPANLGRCRDSFRFSCGDVEAGASRTHSTACSCAPRCLAWASQLPLPGCFVTNPLHGPDLLPRCYDPYQRYSLGDPCDVGLGICLVLNSFCLLTYAIFVLLFHTVLFSISFPCVIFFISFSTPPPSFSPTGN